MEKQNINQGHSESFLVCDKSFKNMDGGFFDWLQSEGFKHAWYKGHYGCDWIYINSILVSKEAAEAASFAD